MSLVRKRILVRIGRGRPDAARRLLRTGLSNPGRRERETRRNRAARGPASCFSVHLRWWAPWKEESPRTRPMRLGSRQSLSLVSVIAGSAICLVAALLGWSGMMTIGGLAAALGLFGLYGGERGVPQASDTEAFLVGLLAARGYAGAFELKDLQHEVFTGGGSSRLLVRFAATLTFSEALYRVADAPGSLFEGFSPRRLSWVRKVVAQLVDENIAGAAELRSRMPPDMYQRRHVVVKTAKGSKARISGTATAAHTATGWVYTLEEFGGTLGTTADTGEPLAGLGDVLILNHRDSERWVRETTVAWRRYEREVQAMRQKADIAQADHAARAIESFFATVKAGTFFHGTGEAMSRQQGPAYFFLEVVSADAEKGTVVFLLRNDGTWSQARRFAGSVGYNEGEHAVEINAVTRAEDAFPSGGPVVGGDGAFALRFHFAPGMPSGLSTFGGDLMLLLEEVQREALEPIRNRAYARRQRLADTITPGATFVGQASSARGAQALAMTFLPGADRASVLARIETADWSGVFTVQERCNRYETAGYDLVLEPVVNLGGERPQDPSSHDAWTRVNLVVEENQLSGRIECPGPALQVALRRSSSGTGARAAVPKDALSA